MLFHVTADTTWSNLPLSGLFVDMLRKIVALAGAPPPDKQSAPAAASGERRPAARPARTLDGFGAWARRLSPPSRFRLIFPARPTPPIRPASTGPADALVAVNALAPTQELSVADYSRPARADGRA